MPEKNVLIVGEIPNKVYYQPFKKYGKDVYESEILWTNPNSINLVVFTGGVDISPVLYDQETSYRTSTAPKRDIFEMVVFTKAHALNLKMVGICRGAQFLNIMAGGKLVQHLDNHTYYHLMTTIDNREFEISSTHHQMMIPPEDAKLIGWSTKRRSKAYISEKEKVLPPPEKETEVLYWPKIKAIGMQYHPEIMSEFSDGFRFASELVDKYLFKQKLGPNWP